MSLPDLNAMTEELRQQAYRKNNPASHMQERVMRMISAYESLIDSDAEISAELVGSNTPAFHLRSIRASDPDILMFSGKDSNGQPVMLVQHHSQMAIFLSSTKKLDEKPFRIGFTAKQD